MLYSCTQMTTVGVKGLSTLIDTLSLVALNDKIVVLGPGLSLGAQVLVNVPALNICLVAD